MASPDLRRLWKLHLIDAAIQEIRARAASLDVGQKIQAEIDALTKQLDANGTKQLQAEQQDLDLQQKSLNDKIAKFDKELYGGKLVNSKEIANIEKEIEILKKQRGTIEERILEIWEVLPPLKLQADKIEKAILGKKNDLVEQRKKAVSLKAQLEAGYKQKTAERPAAAKEVGPALLARYETIRSTHHGIAMAEIVKGNQCGMCGTLQPERTLQACLDDKVVTCESCHRFLYLAGGVI